jgi:uncharacterized BrkB/YihY/UPF0761 family membrane protein
VRRRLSWAFDLYWGSGVCDDVPALAWYLVTALVPLAIGMTALASLAQGDYDEAQAVAERAAQALPPGVGDQVVQLILRTRRDSPLLLALSILAMTWTSAGAVGVVERSMSRQLGRARFGPLLLKSRHLSLAFGVTVLIVATVLAGSRATNLQGRLGLDGTGAQVLLGLAGVLATVAVCAALYRFSPRDLVHWRPAIAGAIPAAAVLLAVPSLVGFYLAAVAGTTPVRIFLVLAGVLFTCYLTAIALLVGAALAVRGEQRPVPAAAPAPAPPAPAAG